MSVTADHQRLSDILVNVGATVLAIFILVVVIWVTSRASHLYDRWRGRRRRHH